MLANAPSAVILRCALLRASKDEKRPWPILRFARTSRVSANALIRG